MIKKLLNCCRLLFCRVLVLKHLKTCHASYLLTYLKPTIVLTIPSLLGGQVTLLKPAQVLLNTTFKCNIALAFIVDQCVPVYLKCHWSLQMALTATLPLLFTQLGGWIWLKRWEIIHVLHLEPWYLSNDDCNHWIMVWRCLEMEFGFRYLSNRNCLMIITFFCNGI